jgi:hypothetical protein
MVTYKHSSGSTTTVEIYGIVRNGRGQVQNTVTESVALSAGQNLTIPIYAGGLPPSIYELSTFAVALNGTAMSYVDVYNFQTVPGGSLFIGEATDWTLTKTPSLADDLMSVTYKNNLNITVMAAVGWIILYNSVGQTVYFSAGGLPNLAPGETGTGYIPLHGLPSGTYYATVFATSTSMVAISNSTAPFAFTH